MKVAFSQLQEDIGLKLLPVFTELATFFVDTLIPALENAYNTVVPALKSAWDDLSAALGPIIEQIRDFLAPIIEKIINFLKENTEVVKVFMAVLAGAAAVAMIVALVAAFTSLFNPVTLVIGAIAAAAAGVAYAWNNFETFRDIVTGVFEVIQTAVEIWWSVIEWVFENVLGGMDGLQKTAFILQTAFEVSFGAIKTVVMSIYDAIKSVIDIAKSAIDAVSNVVDKAKSIPGAGIVSSALGAIGGILPFADGGIVTGPTVGLVGEAGPEAIIPLSQLGRFGGGQTVNVTVNAGMGTDGASVGRQIVEVLNIYAASGGAQLSPALVR